MAVPSSKRIKKHDVGKGPVPSTKSEAALVFLDPPYWNLKAEKYANASASSLPWKYWTRWLRRVAKSAAVMARPGGYVTCLQQDTLTRGTERFQAGRSSSVETLRAFDEAGLEVITMIACPLPTQQASSYDVEWAKREKRILGINRQRIMGRKI